MRNVLLFMHMSLDGFVSGPKGEFDWAIGSEKEMNDELLYELVRTNDTVLLGRVAYHELAATWPKIPDTPGSSKGEREFAHWISQAPKIVFSKTLSQGEWANSSVVKGDIAEEIKKLKQQEGKDLVLFGGASLAQTFVEHDLIDEYRLVVHPVLLGQGKSLFQENKNKLALKLIQAKAFQAGAVLLCYQKA
jgi:dihydrofolate reductase